MTDHPSYKDAEKYSLSYNSFLAHATELVQLIQKAGKKYEAVYAIPRGGLVLGVFLSHALGIPMVDEVHKGVLVVDDLADTGDTLQEYYKEEDVAVLFMKPWSTFTPTYFVSKTEYWIEFMWEFDIKKRLGEIA